MADLGGDFNANDVDPNKTFDLIPEGWYEAMIVDSERKPTKANDGQELISLKLQVTAGAHKGQPLYDNLNLWNHNEKTVQIARGTLSAICRAVGVLQVRETTALHNLPMLVKVAVEPRSDTGAMSNKIKGYKPREASAPVSATGPAPTGKPATSGAPAPAPVGGGAAPWAKKATG